MNCKRWLLMVIVFLITSNFFLCNAKAQFEESELQDDSVVQGVQKLQETVEERRWEYLSQKWKEIFLKNKAISTIDNFLRKINFIFIILFGQDYDISLTLLFLVLLWVFFLLTFDRTITSFSTFSRSVSFVISLILVVLLAHGKVFYWTSQFLFKVIFYREGVWRWVTFGVFILVYFVFLGYLNRLIWIVGRKFKETQEEKEEWDRRFRIQLFDRRMRTMEDAFSEVGSAFGGDGWKMRVKPPNHKRRKEFSETKQENTSEEAMENNGA